MVVDGEGDGVALGGRVHRDLVAAQRHVGPPEVAERRQAGRRGRVRRVAAVAQDLGRNSIDISGVSPQVLRNQIGSGRRQFFSRHGSCILGFRMTQPMRQMLLE